MTDRTRERLLKAALLFALLPWYLLLFTSTGNYFHGGTPPEAMMLDALTVTGAYACLEVFRKSTSAWTRRAAVVIGAPTALLVAFGLFHALSYIARDGIVFAPGSR